MRLVERRIGLLSGIFCLLFATILARAVWLQVVDAGALKASAHSQQTDLVTVPGHRGTVLDRHGKPLAVSEDAASVIATPYQVKDPAATATRLAPLLHVTSNEILAKLANRHSGFAYLAREVSLPIAQRIREMKIAGIGLSPDARRTYPQGPLASQVIGAVGVDNQGLTGLERSEDGVLRGSDGEQKIVRDALGQALQLKTVKPALSGRTVRLTVDSAIQARTESVLADVGKTYDPKDATAIVMDPSNGDVLAMANWPPADPKLIGDLGPGPFANHATGLTYEPGSTFKSFTVAGALSEGLVNPETVFDLPPEIQVADRTIGESHDRGAVSLSVAQILAQSSNVGAVKIGLLLGRDRFDSWVRRFGFGRPTGIDFPGEERGIVPQPQDYSGSSLGNLPIGQGLSVTPIQMATAYSAIANGGILRAPRLIEDVGSRAVPEARGQRVISPTVADQLRQMLKGVLEPGGTASQVTVPGYELAGKTGTAQKPTPTGYSDTLFVSSFVGFAPADNPRLLAAIIVDEPKGGYYGGQVAAPAFGKIAAFALPYLGIAPN
jgi:cell division protein FtsI (penicillin-binding protein 3)